MEIGTQKIKLNRKYKIVISIISGLSYSGILCLIHYITDKDLETLIVYIIHGLVFGFLMGFVFTEGIISKNFGRKFTLSFDIKPELVDNEKIEIEGPANLFRGFESVGGKIFLTNKKLIFRSHKLNIQNGQTEIEYNNITKIQKRKTAKLIDNGIRIRTKEGKEFDFVVDKREVWFAELNKKMPHSNKP